MPHSTIAPSLHKIFGQVRLAFEQPYEPSVSRGTAQGGVGASLLAGAEEQFGAALLAASLPQIGPRHVRESQGAVRKALFTRIMVTDTRPARREPKRGSGRAPARARERTERNGAVFLRTPARFPTLDLPGPSSRSR